MNLVSLIGRVVKEVEVQQLQPSGKSVFNNTIAVQNVYRNNDDSYHSHFIQVVAWGKIAERIGKFVKKGDRIGVEGRLNTRRYTNKNHQEVYVTEVVIEQVYFLERKSFCGIALRRGIPSHHRFRMKEFFSDYFNKWSSHCSRGDCGSISQKYYRRSFFPTYYARFSSLCVFSRN